MSAIMVDGTGSARLRVSGLEIIATARPLDTSVYGSVFNAIRFEGQLRSPDPTHPGNLTTPLARGEFVAHHTSTKGTGLGFALRDANNVRAQIADNDVRDARLIGVFFADLGNSQVLVEDNFISADSIGLWVLRDPRPKDAPSTFHVIDNRFVITDRSSSLSGYPSDGIGFLDGTRGGGIDRVLIRHNDITLIALGAPFLGIFEGIFVIGDRGNVRIVENKISGHALDAGIWIDSSAGTRTRHNDFSGLVGPPDVVLTDTTSDCRVVEPGATVLDEGINNIVHTAPRSDRR